MTETYTTKFTLCGKKMYVSWSFHALRRAEERLGMNEHEIDAALKKSIQKASRVPVVQESLSSLLGDWVIFDAEDKKTFILCTNGDNLIHVISCGSSDMHPHDGSMTLQINATGKVRLICWTKPSANRIAAGLTRPLNGRNLEVYWTGECAKIAENPRNLRVLKSQVAKTIAWLDHGDSHVEEDKTINVWNWQTHTFCSLMIHSDNNTLDIMLFRSARFRCKRECIRVDITRHGCEYVFPLLKERVKASMASSLCYA